MTDDDPSLESADVTTTPVDERAAAAAQGLPDCPRCGRPVWIVTVSGPGVGTASPCGCPVVPGSLERE
ncbi:hypothetical protein HTG_07045 [Natrinema mahii]|nr:hypothetical protein HTG_07045 [Natrinema mahii]